MEIPDNLDLSACPKCGSRKVHPMQESIEGGWYHYVCQDCGAARGRNRDFRKRTLAEAKADWELWVKEWK